MRKIRHAERLPEQDASGEPSASPLVIHWANQMADKIDEVIDRLNSVSDKTEDAEKLARDVRSLTRLK